MSENNKFKISLKEWIANYENNMGSRLKVLHIGNIANNAYNNAKLMNELGVDCDVLSPDYYHIMGTPEWEDADFDAEINDHFHPDWSHIDLKGFQRPEWFVQGPIKLSLNYLLKKRAGSRLQASKLWQELSYYNKTAAIPKRKRYSHYIYAFITNLIRYLEAMQDPDRVMRVLNRNLYKLSKKIRSFLNIRQFNADADKTLSSNKISLINQGKEKTHNFDQFPVWLNSSIYILVVAISKFTRLIFFIFDKLNPKIDSLIDIKQYSQQYNNLFPQRNYRFTILDFTDYISLLRKWKKVLNQYDIILAYSTCPIYPMIACVPYFALEHGTLRDVPFGDSIVSRLTALAYKNAQHVFVTNSDCMENAHFFANDRATFIPHPFDENTVHNITGWEKLRIELCKELDADFLFFFPTRHDWVKGAGYADKANDRFLYAFSALKKKGYRVGLITCEWGNNVEESKELLLSLNVDRHVKWKKVMGVVNYNRHLMAADVIVDQFLLGAFGGVTFRALAAGKPVCTYLEEKEVTQYFGECPPVLNCKSEQ